MTLEDFILPVLLGIFVPLLFINFRRFSDDDEELKQ